jgi:hypothetical protein
MTQRLTSFVRLPIDVGGTVEADPTGAYLVFDSLTGGSDQSAAGAKPVADAFGGTSEVILERLDLATFSRSAFAPCFSARLSPKGKYFVCRDAAGNVLKVALRGGQPLPVAESGVSASEVYTVWSRYFWPAPVSFPSPDRMTFGVTLRDRAPLERDVRWTE